MRSGGGGSVPGRGGVADASEGAEKAGVEVGVEARGIPGWRCGKGGGECEVIAVEDNAAASRTAGGAGRAAAGHEGDDIAPALGVAEGQGGGLPTVEAEAGRGVFFEQERGVEGHLVGRGGRRGVGTEEDGGGGVHHSTVRPRMAPARVTGSE